MPEGTPTYLTIGPDGSVSATFTGDLNLVINRPAAGTTSDDSINFLLGGVPLYSIVGSQSSSPTFHKSVKIGGSNSGDPYVSVENDPTFGDQINAFANGRIVQLLNAVGQSSFVRFDSNGVNDRRRSQMGTSTLTWSGGLQSNTLTLPISGFASIQAIVATANTNVGMPITIVAAIGAGSLANITGWGTSAFTGTATVGWMVWGT